MYTLLAPGARTLLSYVTYDQSEMPGAPWSVSQADLTETFSADRWELEFVEEAAPGQTSRFLKPNGGQLTWIRDGVAFITRK